MNHVETWIESALHSPFGQSGGQFSDFATVGPTQVPAFVMHRRDVIEAVGGWDEAYLTSQDSELSMRLLQSGYSLYRSPNSEVTMRKRTSLGKWWKMSHRYGFWRTKVLKKYPQAGQMERISAAYWARWNLGVSPSRISMVVAWSGSLRRCIIP